MYQFDAQNLKTDALIRHFNDQSFEKIKNRFEHQIKTLLSFDKLKIQSIDIKKNDAKNLKKKRFSSKKFRTRMKKTKFVRKFDDV